MSEGVHVGMELLPHTVEPVYLTVAEVARLFDRSPQMIKRWIREGLLPAMTARPRGSRVAYKVINFSDIERAAVFLSTRKKRGRHRSPEEVARDGQLARMAAERNAVE